MFQKTFILFLIFFLQGFSQKIEKKVGAYKITEEIFLTENNKKIAKQVFYFNESGNILEKIKFGRHHYNKLNIIGEIEQFFYKDDKLQLSKKYISSCKSCKFFQYYSKYEYNEGKLISENVFYAENDSLFMSTNYVYKPNLKEIHFNSSVYYLNKYDDENRIIEQNQVYEETNKIRWKNEFSYSDNFRVGKFQTFYNDGKDRSEIEIVSYNSDRIIASKEIIREKYKTKLFYFYDKYGIIKKIEEYESFSEDDYKLIYTTVFKVNRKAKDIDKSVITELNSALMESN